MEDERKVLAQSRRWERFVPLWPALAAAAGIAGVLAAGFQQARRAAPRPDPPPASEWRPLASDSPFAAARTVAFAAEGALTTDGVTAHYHPPNGGLRPLEAPVALSRVFSAGGRLFAFGQSEGAPFLVGLAAGEAMVTPVPCSITRLAGEGEVFLAACEDGDLALSSDSARTFVSLGLNLPGDSEALAVTAVEAVGVGPGGELAYAAARRWEMAQGDERLLWTRTYLGWRAGSGPFRPGLAPRLIKTVGLRLNGRELRAAGFEASPELPPGEVRPRLYRAVGDGAPEPLGSPGPRCGAPDSLEALSGVFLGPSEAAFACGGQVALTLDAGRTWSLEEGLPPGIRAVDGGGMRLLARKGDQVFERVFALHAPDGAAALRLRGERPPPPALPGSPPPIRVRPLLVREPQPGALPQAP